MFGQNGEIFLPFSQRGHVDGNEFYPIKKVLSEITIFHGFPQISIRGGNEKHVGIEVFDASDTPKLPFLNDSEEFSLQVVGHMANLI